MRKGVLLLLAITSSSCAVAQKYVDTQVARAQRLKEVCGSDGGGPSALAALAPAGDMSGSLAAILRVGETWGAVRNLGEELGALQERVKIADATLDVLAAWPATSIGDRVGHVDDKLIAAVLAKLEQGTGVTDALKLEIGALVRALDRRPDLKDDKKKERLERLAQAVRVWRAIADRGKKTPESLLGRLSGIHQRLVQTTELVRLSVTGACTVETIKNKNWAADSVRQAAVCIEAVRSGIEQAFEGAAEIKAEFSTASVRANFDGVLAEVTPSTPEDALRQLQAIQRTKTSSLRAELAAVLQELDTVSSLVGSLRVDVPELGDAMEPVAVGRRDIAATVRTLGESLRRIQVVVAALKAKNLDGIKEVLFQAQASASVDTLLKWVVRMIGILDNRLNTAARGNVLLSIAVSAGRVAGIDDMIAKAFTRAIVEAIDAIGIPRAVLISRTCSLTSSLEGNGSNLVSLFLDGVATYKDPPPDPKVLLTASLAHGVARSEIQTIAQQSGVRLSTEEEDALAAELGSRLLPFARDAKLILEGEAALRGELTVRVLVDVAAELKSPVLERLAAEQALLSTRLVDSYGELITRSLGADQRELDRVNKLTDAIEKVITHSEADYRRVVASQDIVDDLIRWCLEQKPTGSSITAWSCSPQPTKDGRRVAVVYYQVESFPDCGFELTAIKDAEPDRKGVRDKIDAFRPTVVRALTDHASWEVVVTGLASTKDPFSCPKSKLRDTEKQWWKNECDLAGGCPVNPGKRLTDAEKRVSDALNVSLATKRADEALQMLLQGIPADLRPRIRSSLGKVSLDQMPVSKSVILLIQERTP
jgi:hypothetical protein